MALNIKNARVEALATEVATAMGESKTEAIRKALEERKARLSFKIARGSRLARMMSLLETEIWPEVPRSVRGKKVTKREKERILGLGEDGA